MYKLTDNKITVYKGLQRLTFCFWHNRRNVKYARINLNLHWRETPQLPVESFAPNVSAEFSLLQVISSVIEKKPSLAIFKIWNY